MLGNGVFSACLWGVMVAIARLGTAADVGQYALALAVTAPIMLFCNLSLRQVLATDAGRAHTFGDYLRLRHISSLVGLVVIVAVGLCGRWEASTALLICAIGLTKVVESASDIYNGLQQRLQLMRVMATSLILRGVCGFSLMALTYALTRSLNLAALALVVCWGAVLLLHDVPRGRTSEVVLAAAARSRSVLGLARVALPMGFAAMLISLNVNVPRYFVEHSLGSAALGHFAALAYVAAIGGLIVNSVGQALSPQLAERAAARNRREFLRLQAWFALIAAGVGTVGLCVALVAGKPLLRLLYGVEYAEHVDVLVWLLVAGAVSYLVTVLDYGLMARRQFVAMPVMQAMVVAVNVLACLVLVPRYGLRAAAWSWLIALLVQAACEAWLVLVRGWGEPLPPRQVAG